MDVLTAATTVALPIGVLTQLTDIGVGGNEMTGTLPSELGALSSVFYMALQNNEVCNPAGLRASLAPALRPGVAHAPFPPLSAIGTSGQSS